MATSTATPTETPLPTSTATATATSTATATATPPGIAVVDVQPEQGAAISFANQENLTTTIEIPPNAVNAPIQLVYTDLPDPGSGDTFQLVSRFFRLAAYQDGAPLAGYVFQTPIRMIIEYREADLGGVAEADLELRYYDAATGEWRTDGIIVEQRDVERNLIIVLIAHLTDFALAGNGSVIYLPSIAR